MNYLKNSEGEVFGLVRTETLLTEYGSIFGFKDTIITQRHRGLSSEEKAVVKEYILSHSNPYNDVWDQYLYDFMEVDYDTFMNIIELDKKLEVMNALG